ncbi:MAG: Uma2 family endonuclease [Myxococcales bacterium]|nr:Uma2 family endonuclease [Myxococcales bacterium]
MGGKAPDDDVVWYPSEDHMGVHELQTWLAVQLWLSVRRHLAEQRRDLRSGHDQFFYWKKGDPTARLAPDVYVLDVRGPDEFMGVWKTWEGPYAPAFAVEIVGDDFRKDYDDAPVGYATMGTRELVIFDPWATQRSRVRVRWQVYRAGADGKLVEVETSNGPAVWSEFLQCWLRRVIDDSGRVGVRLSLDEAGTNLVLTADESTTLERERAEQERERAEQERERAEREQHERRAAEEKLAKLRAKLVAAGIDPDE